MVYFGEKSAKISVFFADFSPKMTKVCPKYVSWGSNKDGVAITRIRYILVKVKKLIKGKITLDDKAHDYFHMK